MANKNEHTERAIAVFGYCIVSIVLGVAATFVIYGFVGDFSKFAVSFVTIAWAVRR